MGSYNHEYRKYYQGLQKSSGVKNSSPIYTRESLEALNSNYRPSDKKKEFFSSMSNIFIYQLVVVIFMLGAGFYLKYSPDSTETYANVKAVMNDNTYISTGEEADYLSISEVINRIGNYIKSNLNGEKADF